MGLWALPNPYLCTQGPGPARVASQLSPGAQEPRAWEEGEAGLSPAGSLCLFYKKFI